MRTALLVLALFPWACGGVPCQAQPATPQTDELQFLVGSIFYTCAGTQLNHVPGGPEAARGQEVLTLRSIAVFPLPALSPNPRWKIVATFDTGADTVVQQNIYSYAFPVRDQLSINSIPVLLGFNVHANAIDPGSGSTVDQMECALGTPNEENDYGDVTQYVYSNENETDTTIYYADDKSRLITNVQTFHTNN